MKRQVLLSSALLLALWQGGLPAVAQQFSQTVKLKTTKEIGSTLTLTTDANVWIDWGDGNLVESNERTVTGTLKGQEIAVYGNSSWGLLDISNCGISVMNTTQAPNLTSIYARNNELTGVNILQNAELKDFDVANNQLTGITLVMSGKASNLERLNVSGNKIKSLNLNGCTALQYIDASNNSITSLSLGTGSKAPANLDVLNCSNNQISSLNLSGTPSISSFVGHNNKLRTLTLSGDDKGSQMVDFICDNNQLGGTLDLSDAKEMKNMSCTKNNLSKVALAKNGDLYSYRCYDNALTLTSISTKNIETMGAYFEFLPQAAFDISSQLMQTKEKENYAFSANASDGATEINLADERKDLDNNFQNTTFACYANGGSTEPTLLTEGTDYENSGGKITFLKEFNWAYITITNKRAGLTVRSIPFDVVKNATEVGIADVNAAGSGLEIATENGSISLRSPQGTTPVKIYSTGGQLLWNGMVGTATQTIQLGKGTYIVNHQKVIL